MAKGMYVGVNGVARKVKKMYVGVNSVARKVKKVYVGVNGVARLAWQGTVPAGQVTFTSSQLWTVPEGVSKIDIFCVGGGGGSLSTGGSKYTAITGAGSGYTSTVKNINVVPGQQIPITVGAGGTVIETSSSPSYGNAGGQSVFGSYCHANGGEGAMNNSSYNHPMCFYRTDSSSLPPNPDKPNNSNGGSGGGGVGLAYYYDNGETYVPITMSGGVDGAISAAFGSYANNTYLYWWGHGQGYTTKAFGEAQNTLYSTGGSANASTPQTPNTGNGGNGGLSYIWTVNPVYGTSGQSGIVIVRWAEQEQ
ncbi:glycine-rich domain-containing protein [Anaerocolumna xylanovorans]|uniref:Glycine-rich domain-containing protein n=1 Tax=Anaerocolumna xylanovorans DSM 12503 TaxID=1121345 RepID=A0A1M7YM65_9FIRM|nr:hypothetical protein [Anaerocolumna xylanovorans]SHO53711.1 hypothetical protein SAMN02745217_04250 [Anaerocolumna xylanovorans DSM 12503]